MNIPSLVSSPSAGAISTFIGTTRDSFNGKRVERLEYEAYESMALKVFAAIATECRKRWDLLHIAFYHRLGVVPVQECSVYLAISSVHRRDSLLAVHWAIDQIKAKAPIWKKEVYSDGSVWKQNQEWDKDEILHIYGDKHDNGNVNGLKHGEMAAEKDRTQHEEENHCKSCHKH
jgi:molybdopterin synthase catalytic subunit